MILLAITALIVLPDRPYRGWAVRVAAVTATAVLLGAIAAACWH